MSKKVKKQDTTFSHIRPAVMRDMCLSDTMIFRRYGTLADIEPTTITIEVKMDDKIKKSEKKIEKVEKKEFKGLLKEDKKLDSKREKLEKEVAKKKK